MRVRTFVCGGLVAALCAVPVPSALAEETTCRGKMGKRTVVNLRVPQGENCVLRGTTIKGTLKVERNATLDAKNIKVVDSIQAENADSVEVRKSRIGGSFQIVQGGRARLVNSRVEGDVLYDDNRRKVTAVDNNVGGSIQAFQNEGGVKIRGNTVDGNLQCKENSPEPTGGNNQVGGTKEDQCSAL